MKTPETSCICVAPADVALIRLDLCSQLFVSVLFGISTLCLEPRLYSVYAGLYINRSSGPDKKQKITNKYWL